MITRTRQWHTALTDRARLTRGEATSMIATTRPGLSHRFVLRCPRSVGQFSF